MRGELGPNMTRAPSLADKPHLTAWMRESRARPRMTPARTPSPPTQASAHRPAAGQVRRPQAPPAMTGQAISMVAIDATRSHDSTPAYLGIHHKRHRAPDTTHEPLTEWAAPPETRRATSGDARAESCPRPLCCVVCALSFLSRPQSQQRERERDESIAECWVLLLGSWESRVHQSNTIAFTSHT